MSVNSVNGSAKFEGVELHEFLAHWWKLFYFVSEETYIGVFISEQSEIIVVNIVRIYC